MMAEEIHVPPHTISDMANLSVIPSPHVQCALYVYIQSCMCIHICMCMYVYMLYVHNQYTPHYVLDMY